MMSPNVLGSIRACPWATFRFAVILTCGCSGRVDLGDSVPASPPTPTTNAIEQSVGTENLARVPSARIDGVALDASHLYLASLEPNDMNWSLQRCEKRDCWQTLKRLRPLGWADGGIDISVGELGWINDDGFQLCSTPECTDARAEPGVIVEPGIGHVPMIWTSDHVYWVLQTDQAIYACSRPGCTSGPLHIAKQKSAQNMQLVGSELYWFDIVDKAFLRTPTDGTGPTERLTFEQQTAWTTAMPDETPSPNPQLNYAQIDGPWVYAVIIATPTVPNDGPCLDCAHGRDLARWRYGEDGAAREWLLVDDATFDNLGFVRVIDGEIFWIGTLGGLWSCLADNCVATKRQLGVDAQVAQGQGLVADEQFVYWLSAPCDEFGGCGPEWILKRTPRIAK